MAIKYPKKIDYRLTDEEFDKIIWLTNELGAKKSSYSRQSVMVRVDNDIKSLNLEEKYEQFKKNRAEATTN